MDCVNQSWVESASSIGAYRARRARWSSVRKGCAASRTLDLDVGRDGSMSGLTIESRSLAAPTSRDPQDTLSVFFPLFLHNAPGMQP